MNRGKMDGLVLGFSRVVTPPYTPPPSLLAEILSGKKRKSKAFSLHHFHHLVLIREGASMRYARDLGDYLALRPAHG